MNKRNNPAKILQIYIHKINNTLLLIKASLCQIPAVLQVKHVEYIGEKCRSTAVKSSTGVKVANVTESLFMESILVDFVIAEKSIHWKHVFWYFHISNSFRF